MTAAPSLLMEKRNDVSVKVDEHVVKRAKIAAAHKGVSLAEFLSDVIRVASEEEIAEIHPETLGPAKKKGVK